MRHFLFCWPFYDSANYLPRFRGGLLLLAGLLNLASCDPHPEAASPPAARSSQAGPRAAAKPAPTAPAKSSPTEPTEQPPLKLVDGDTIRYRRYAGTLGTRRVYRAVGTFTEK